MPNTREIYFQGVTVSGSISCAKYRRTAAKFYLTGTYICVLMCVPIWKPFEDHVNDLMERLPLRILKGDRAIVRERLRNSLLALARDQRHVCAEKIQAMGSANVRKDEAHQIVMNAPLP